jgi:hypothetical protein
MKKEFKLKTVSFLASLVLTTLATAQGGQKWSVNGNGINANNFLGTTNNNDLIFKSNDVEGFRLNPNGDIGIGTTAPVARLDLNGSFRLNDGSQQAGYFLATDANGNATWQALPAPATNWTLGSGNLYYTGGFVGIGTTAPGTSTPNAKLEVKGRTVINGTDHTETRLTFSNAGIGATQIFWDESTDLFNIQASRAGGAGINFIVRDVANAYHDVLNLNKNTNVGIGTQSPSAKLDLVGTFQLEDGTQGAGHVLTSDANGNASWQALSTPSMLWTASGSDVYYTGGNVGIATTSPQDALTVAAGAGNGMVMRNTNGDERASFRMHNTSDYGFLNVYNNSDTRTVFLPGTGNGYVTAGNFSIGTTSHNNYKLNVQANSYQGIGLTHNSNPVIALNKHNTVHYGMFEMYDNTQTRTIGLFASNTHSYINTGRNFGIGTTQPSSPLTVAGTIETTAGGVKFPDGSVQTTAAAAQQGSQTNPYADLYATDVNIDEVYADDFMKVGTNSLYLTGSTTFNNSTSGNEIFTSNGPLYINPVGATVVAKSGTVTSTGSNTLINPHSGNVGIGTVSPLQELHVNGNLLLDGNAANLMFGKTSGSFGGEWILTYDEANQGMELFKPVPSATGLLENVMFITDAGNVGINTDEPLAPLHVSGDVYIGDVDVDLLRCPDCVDYQLFVRKGIRTEAIKVDVAQPGGWADYVFDEDYQLSSLSEVEEFIDENGHLPAVPSAKKVESDGINVAEMDAILLRKIEELTLYIIDQNKKIEELEKRIID